MPTQLKESHTLLSEYTCLELLIFFVIQLNLYHLKYFVWVIECSLKRIYTSIYRTMVHGILKE